MSSEHEPSELDPSGVLTRSDEAGGYVSLTSVQEPIRPRERGASGLVPRWWPAAVALILVVAVIMLDAVAVGLAGSGSFDAATVVAWVAIALSALAVVAGVVCIALGRGRRVAIVVVIAGILANPFLLTRILELVSP